ncbi:HEAT repeat domain-containing protein, partial [Streptomyces sp. NPDC048551]|uniref:HEAT repeat domain-containing protein n=1 Tax=Streptomyces sp. NPDC048551 TaxID=3155758 RepID=UPI003422C7A9
MFEPVIAPSGTLLGLLQRGRGDGTLHALAAPRPEALAALDHCVLRDPRQDWQVENRSLYYARLYLDLDGPLGEIEAHLFAAEDLVDEDEHRTGLALSVLGHLASYGRDDALMLLRRYAASGANWSWALDELALRDDDEGLRSLADPVLARFPDTAEGGARLAAAVRDAYEPRPWCLWEETPRYGERLRAARQQGSFDRWQRQLTPSGPRPGWGVQAVFDWAADGLRRGTPLHVPAARCLAAVAGPEDRPAVLAAAAGADGEAARATALHHLVLAEPENPAVLDLIEAAGDEPAVAAYERMCGPAALDRARMWVHRPDALGAAAAALLAARGVHQGGVRGVREEDEVDGR